MSNPISFEELFDIAGMLAGYKQLLTAEKEFATQANKDLGILDKSVQVLKIDMNKLIVEFESLNDATDRGQKKLKDLIQQKDATIKAYREQSAAVLANKKVTDEFTIAISKLKEENKKLARELLDNKNNTALSRIESEKLAKAKIDLKNRTSEEVIAVKIASANMKAAAGSYDEANKKAQVLLKSIKATEGGFNSTSPAIKRQITEYNNLNQKLKDFDRQLGINYRSVGDYKLALGNVRDSLISFAAGYISIQAALSAGKEIFNTSIQLDSLNQKLVFVSTNTRELVRNQLFLSNTAEELGLNILSLTSGFVDFAGATRGTKFEGEETRRIFLATAKASTVLKLSVADTEGVFKALGQIISKGKVQAEELRGQLGDRLSGAFKLFADGLGISTAELDKLLKKGEITSDALSKFATQLEKTFNPSVSQNVDSLQAAVNRLNNEFTEAVSGGRSSQFFKDVVNGFADSLSGVRKLVNSGSWKEFTFRFFGTGAGFLNALNGDKIDQMFAPIQSGFEKGASAAEKYIRKLQEAGNGTDLQLISEELKLINDDFTKAQDNVYALFGSKDELLKNDAKYHADYYQALKIALEDYYNSQKKLQEKERELESDKEKSSRLAREKRAIKEKDDFIKASTELRLAELEKSHIKEKTSEIDYENEKLKILNESYLKRQALYRKDSTEYLKIEGDKVKATVDALDKINDIELKNDRRDTSSNDKLLSNTIKDQLSEIDSSRNAQLNSAKLTNQEVLEIEAEAIQKKIELLEKYRDASADIDNQIIALKGQKSEKEIEIEQKKSERLNFIIQQSQQLIGTILEEASIRGGINIQNEQKQLEEKYQYELEMAGDNDAAKKAIEKKYQKEQKELKKREAIANRNMTLFNIALNTIAASIAALVSVPPNVPLSIAIGIQGAISAGLVASRPLPQFYKGVESSPEGPAIVGEKGRELVREPDGNMRLTGNKAELTYLKKGSKVFTASQTRDILKQGEIKAKINQDAQYSQELTKKVVEYEMIKSHSTSTKNISLESMKEAFSSSIKTIPIQVFNLDESGYRRSIKKGNTNVVIRNRKGGI